MFPEPTELLLIGCLTESVWTPKIQIKYIDTKNQLADVLTKRNFTRDKWNHLLCLFNISHQLFWSDVKKNARRIRWTRSHSEIKADDEFGFTIQREGSERACFDCIGKHGENQIWKSECTSELVDWAASKNRETCEDAYSSNYSEWNADKNSSSQEWKSDDVLEARTGRFVDERTPSLFKQHTDRLIVENDNMDSNTLTESDFSVKKTRSFLRRVNDRVRKMLDQSSKDATQDSNKHSLIWECLCLRHWKHLFSWERITQKICNPPKIQERISQWNRCWTHLKSW